MADLVKYVTAHLLSHPDNRTVVTEFITLFTQALGKLSNLPFADVSQHYRNLDGSPYGFHTTDFEDTND
jgi:hypothetical protein